jgi:hypothetical protein
MTRITKVTRITFDFSENQLNPVTVDKVTDRDPPFMALHQDNDVIWIPMDFVHEFATALLEWREESIRDAVHQELKNG